MKQHNEVAYLFNKDDYTFFKIGRETIRFATSPYLIRYTKVKHYHNGYMIIDAEFMEPNNPNKSYIDEDYIDIEYIFTDLNLNTAVLGNIKEVCII